MHNAPIADDTDIRLMRALREDPRAAVVALAERTGLSRNTVQARLARWDGSAVLLSFDHRIDPAFLGYPMRAFILARVKQRMLSEVAESLTAVPEVIEVVGLSGGVDLHIVVAARDADDLYRIAGRILGIRGVKRTNTSLVMRQLIDHRVAQLIQ